MSNHKSAARPSLKSTAVLGLSVVKRPSRPSVMPPAQPATNWKKPLPAFASATTRKMCTNSTMANTQHTTSMTAQTVYTVRALR